jgi:ribonuclease BN (tRNA processing enzyme)
MSSRASRCTRWKSRTKAAARSATGTQDADLLVHDSQHTAAELPRLGFLGHSAVEYAVALAQRADARQLALFPHDPWRTDAEIDAFVARYVTAPVSVFAAHQGMVVDPP